MQNKLFKLIFIIFLSIFTNLSFAFSDNVKSFKFLGNDRIPNETIKMLSKVKEGDLLTEDKLNTILIDLYGSNFFEDVSISLENNILVIKVVENPLIDKINFEGVKAKKNLELIKNDLKLKQRSSFNRNLLEDDIDKIKNTLKNLGYYFADISASVEDLSGNKVNINYQIDIGKKAKIKTISFVGDKRFKDSKLKNVIISEEYKFWKIVSGKKYLNEQLIEFDKRLLRNFYLNRGYYNVKINSSFAKLVGSDEFELIYNVNANDKFYFDELKLNLPVDYDKENFVSINKLFKNLKGEPYSLNAVSEIIEELELIVLNEQFESTKAIVKEKFVSNKINLDFSIEQIEKYTVEKINIYGNNITRENVIRNNLAIDEGDTYNDILAKKSENNLKSLNIFRNVKTNVIDGKNIKSKIIEINVQEKPTGEVMAGAGFGTDGGTFQVGVRENNYLGKGIKFDSNLYLSEDSIKGQIGIMNPNFQNTNKSVYLNLESSETDKLNAFGYKTSKTGFEVATNFEYLRNLNLGLGTSSYYEKIETDSSASTRQKKMKGDYWDTFVQLKLDYDRRNQKYRTSKGFRSFYKLDMPIVSTTNTLTNQYDFKYFTEFYEENITSTSILLKSANSITNKDIKLSERLFVPSKRLRGFEVGKVGPKDGNDYIGGNFITALNFNTTIPQLLPSAENFDFSFFIDVANVWGVDYDSSLNKNNDFRSSTGIAVDWMTVVGPLTFSLAQPLSKSDSDVTETFRFNLGTTF